MIWNRCIQFYFHLPIFLRLILSVTLIMLLFGFIIHLIEPSHFPTLFDGVWWAFVTGSTVGYGDYVPLSTLGKAVGIFLILAGGGLVTFYMATISAGTIKHEKDLSDGKIAYRGKNHIIIVGWNERTRQLTEMMRNRQINQDIVLIDHTMRNISYKDHHIHFIHGNPTADDVLQKAKIKDATHAIITADPSFKENEADRQTILNIISAKGNNPELIIVAEILTDIQQKNAERAGANLIIRSNDFMSSLFFQTIFQASNHATDIIAKTLEQQQFCTTPIDPDMAGQNFHACAVKLLDNNKWLIGIMRADEIMIHPDFKLILEEKDMLIYLQPF
ncbi:voltage-gated potassium channel [Gracilibacillus ureilyticus]|uniref:Voltage-gated potassium channel n=1 Tax=Gracilibacillus ureilyticus TaxID=531814 RepID=A0A1H9TRZ7_9BACI|nr:potassium channel family protein [Gracilibacillus ureilyticus]SER99741.1 voltage-gated potassium channel [Gracilibacillus ureilyticus]